MGGAWDRGLKLRSFLLLHAVIFLRRVAPLRNRLKVNCDKISKTSMLEGLIDRAVDSLTGREDESEPRRGEEGQDRPRRLAKRPAIYGGSRPPGRGSLIGAPALLFEPIAYW